MNAGINVLYCAALLIPLVLLVVVLFVRVATLWVVISVSPIIILLFVFRETIKIDALNGDKSFFSFKSIGSLLAAPVVIGFAVSLCTMFIMILKNIVIPEPGPTDPHQFNLLGNLIEINIRGGGAHLSRLLLSIMGVAVVWFILFRAIRMNRVGETL